MGEFILMVIFYSNMAQGPMQMIPFGEYPDKASCESYAQQIRKDLAEPSRQIRTTCLPKSAMQPKAQDSAGKKK